MPELARKSMLALLRQWRHNKDHNLKTNMTQSEKASQKLHVSACVQALLGAAGTFAAAYEQAQGTYDTTVLVMLWLATLGFFLSAAFTNTQAKRAYR